MGHYRQLSSSLFLSWLFVLMAAGARLDRSHRPALSPDQPSLASLHPAHSLSFVPPAPSLSPAQQLRPPRPADAKAVLSAKKSLEEQAADKAMKRFTQKGGKPRRGVNRGAFLQQQKMKEYIKAQQQQRDLDDDEVGFQLFVRQKIADQESSWFPAGMLKGDDKARALANSVVNGGFLATQYQNTLNQGVAKSLFSSAENQERLKDIAQSQYKLNRDALEFGYRLEYKALEEKLKEEGKENEIIQVTADMQEGAVKKWWEGVTDQVAGVFGQKKKTASKA
ncbi:unnamed protein product [Vitrella brassicaformis CCMP3155]|uniref:Uncharacterized protein n=1 Tax=Vitrella brassicaformis (strain CCMP3155) TaxID=1169540 RepID=A0A0G4GEJ4_VITBC|nr:unnamed protein product [Vitrella brassicaformis CCMP3155]|eukprot:CEM27586.1 unnamed protein product [Vitrella brassicaformis CCMP3155]